MTNNIDMSELLLSDVQYTPEQYFAKYPKRALDDRVRVTRFAPSPTGFLHIGGLFSAIASERQAHLSNGRFLLRIEDTDKKREVQNGAEGIINSLAKFGVNYDEGIMPDGSSKGEYAPYIQSQRRDIYRSFVKELVKRGVAYPCFLTAEELAGIKDAQEKNKEFPGCYGKYAKYRDITCEQAKELIEQGLEYVIRFRSNGKAGQRISFEDSIKGKIEMDENITDVVLLKSDGMPTYHFAHVVDDTLMGVTDVVRGDEWIASAPIHLQLFDTLAEIYPDRVKRPQYAHIAPILKEENGGKRKISKRKDPEAAVSYFIEEGYPVEAVRNYLMTLLNSDFEDWKRANCDEPLENFPFLLSKMSASGALFDIKKLQDISKTEISLLDGASAAQEVSEWAYAYDREFFKLIASDEDGVIVPNERTIRILSIDRGGDKPRKDLSKWSEVKDYISYFFEDLFKRIDSLPDNIKTDDACRILDAYAKTYDERLNKDEWFAGLKTLCEPLGFAAEVKTYKKNPGEYKGHVGDLSTVIRIAVTGRKQTPDLCSICSVMGRTLVMERINSFKNILLTKGE